MCDMHLTPVDCPNCGYKKYYTVLYPENFSPGDLNKNIFSARRMPDKIHYQLVQCNGCGLVRSTPTINITQLNNLYKKSRLTYDEEIGNLIVTYLHAMQPILQKLPHSAKILEIGCGNGFLVKELHDLGYINTYGIEPSWDAVNKAHQSVKRNLKHSILKRGMFPEETFDFIFFFQTLDHIPCPNGFLKECHRLLKKNGYILSFNHNIDSLASKLFGEHSPIIDIEHTFLYNPDTISLLFKKHGFKVEKVYSPLNYVSIRHIIRLSPIPKNIKNFILHKIATRLKINIKIKLGNLCLVGRKV
jgi:SAM-dependent methyltransferase